MIIVPYSEQNIFISQLNIQTLGNLNENFNSSISPMTKIKGTTVLVTGGAAGIGKLMGELCLQKGADKLIIWDINNEGLMETSKEFKSKGHQVYAYQVDVSDAKDVESAAYTVLEDIGSVDILVNNAGIVVGKDFAQHTTADIQRTVDINISGVMYTTLAFIDDMLYKGKGHIVNISSAAGLAPAPKMSVYAGSKWAVLGWSESLRLEMERNQTGVKVTTVTPSYIDTGMFDGAKAPLLAPLLSPETIVKQMVEAIENNDILLRSPEIVNYVPLLRGVLPTRIFDRVADVLGAYDSMKEFKGHEKGGK